MRNLILLIFCLALLQSISAQSDSCKVLTGEIAGKYTGPCKDGLANGKGKSVGEDTYTGSFLNGLPHGKGKYTFRNGDEFKGYWENGQKSGKGSFKYSQNGKKHTLSGYWKDDVYAGAADPDVTYRVSQSTGIPVFKVEENAVEDVRDSKIVFSIQRAFSDFLPQDLKIEKSSGQVTQLGRKFMISQFSFPLHCEISYTLTVGQTNLKCRFIVDILQKGEYTVTLDHN